MTLAKRFTLILVLFLCFSVPGFSQSFTGVLTQHNDNARTGQNLNETVLTPQNVNVSTFGKVFSYAVDAQIYAQPLYMPSVSIAGGTHNVVFVATENDSLYAFDADGLTSAPLWHDSFINPAQGITAVPCSDIGCVVFPTRGITSTPVIDKSTDTLYLVTRTLNKGTYFQSLHAIDVTTGAEKFGGPINIVGAVPGTGFGSKNGVVTFSALPAVQRAGLLLANGMVYIGESATGEHGWIMAYDAQTLKRVAIFNSTPNGTLGGIWQSGNGLAADDSGNIYLAVGDGSFDVNTGGIDYGDGLLKLNSDLTVVDYFTPKDQSCRKAYDRDLGSGGPLLLPTQSGPVANELVVAGKQGYPCDPARVTPIYVLNQDDLGQYNMSVDQIVQEVPASSAGYWSSPAYWQGTAGTYLYFAGGNGATGDNLNMYSVSNGSLSTTPAAQSSNAYLVGATPSVSANGTADGVVWTVERQDSLDTNPGDLPAILYAYDATNVSNMLYNSAQLVQRDQGGCGNKFAVPTIANGKVYVGTQNELDVFGLLGSSGSAPNVYLPIPCVTFAAQGVGTSSPTTQVTLTNSGNAALKINQITTTGLNAGDFPQTNNCGSSLAQTTSCTITVKFRPSLSQGESAYVTINDNAVGSPHNIFLTGLGVQSMTVTAGNNQSATVGSTLPTALQVQATTGSGPAAGVKVTFSGPGSFSATIVTTNSNGFASTTYTLPQTSGTYTITANAEAYTPAVFSETATADPVTGLNRAGGNAQQGTVGTTLPSQIVAKAVDQYGNGVPGVSISFSDNGAGGTFSANPVVTNSWGGASVGYTLPTKAQTATVTATAAGLSPVKYSETATAGSATGLSRAGGNAQKGTVGTTLPNPIVAKVVDQYGNGVPGVSISFSDNSAGGTFSANPVVTNSWGGASVSYTLPGKAQTITITATGTGLSSLNYSETAVAGP